MPHYLIIDIENNGMFDWSIPADAPGQPRIAQIGMIHVGPDYKIEAEHEFYIRPEGWSMTPETTAINGLTDEILRERGVPIVEPLALYAAAIEARRVIVGHNVTFDLKSMRAEFRRAGMEDKYLQTRSLCTMWATRAIVNATDTKGKVKIPKLEEACAFFGIPQPKAHSALADAHSAYQLMLKLVERKSLPEPKSPYDKKPKAAKPKRTPRREQIGNDADQDIPDFIGGAAADGK